MFVLKLCMNRRVADSYQHVAAVLSEDGRRSTNNKQHEQPTTDTAVLRPYVWDCVTPHRCQEETDRETDRETSCW